MCVCVSVAPTEARSTGSLGAGEDRLLWVTRSKRWSITRFPGRGVTALNDLVIFPQKQKKGKRPSANECLLELGVWLDPPSETNKTDRQLNQRGKGNPSNFIALFFWKVWYLKSTMLAHGLKVPISDWRGKGSLLDLFKLWPLLQSPTTWCNFISKYIFSS